MKIRAAVCVRPGAPLAVEEIDLDPPRAGEVLVRIAAAGVCRSDLHVLRGDADEPLPTVLGHEGSGVIEEVGPGAGVVRPGDRVVLSWARACGACRLCGAGRPYLCQEGIQGGMLPAGGSRLRRGGRPIPHYGGVSCFATHAVLDVSMVVPVPPATPLDVAALVGCAVTTGLGAVTRTARVPAGATAAIIGCGGVGLALVQGLRLAGAARVIAIDRNPAALDMAASCGATDRIRAGPADAVRACLDLTGEGVEYAFEAVGVPGTVNQAIAMTAPGGTAVMVGMPARAARVEIDLSHLWSGGRRLLTSVYGSADPKTDIPYILDLERAGRLSIRGLITRRYTLDKVNEAFADLESTHAAGRGLILPSGSL